MELITTTQTNGAAPTASSRKARAFVTTFCQAFVLLLAGITFAPVQTKAQGTWTAVTNQAPDFNGGVMLLLTDGTVLAKTYTGGTYGTTWDKLTPDASGSYINGTWTKIAAMHDDRLYFSSQVLKDGRVYVAGGESGSGGTKSEVYNPLTNTWSTPLVVPGGGDIYDGNSEILPDGRVLQGIVTGGSKGNYFFDPTSNTFTAAPSSFGGHDESAWLKLPDSSILFVDIASTTSERYIPSTNTWVLDATVPVALYDMFDYESGAAFMLPNGKAFFIGSTSNTAIYTPSGNTSAGSWVAGPTIPAGLGAPDAAAAMMVNGKIICAFSHTPAAYGDYSDTTVFYEYDYVTNAFTLVSAPGGGTQLHGQCYMTNMLDLPDGNVMFGMQGSKQYYEYTPSGTALAAGKPTVSTVTRTNCDTFLITGTLFTGISEGANFGDDWQMSSNYPIIRLTSGANVYYARSYNWTRIGAVMTSTLADTAQFVLPAGLPAGTYSLAVVVNGNPSSSFSFNPGFAISPSVVSIAPGATTTLTDPMTGGAWSSSNTAVAVVGSASGIVTGVAAGSATITYSGTSCTTTAAVTIGSGTVPVCIGATATLTDATTGGTWSSNNTAVATVSLTGVATGVAVGSATIVHYLAAGGTTNKTVVVNMAPSAIAGSSTVCQGSSLTLTNAVTGGTWSTPNTNITLSSSTGVINGVTAGTAVVNYALGSCSVAKTLTVNPVAAITGGSSLCLGASLSLSNGIAGGTWSSANTSIAAISSDGVATGSGSGTAVIAYTLPTGCSATSLLIVNPGPAPIPASTNICAGATVTLNTTPSGGSWTSGTPSLATVNATTGAVTGLSAGAATITYSISSGCTTTTSIVVNAAPAVISSPGNICVGNTTSLTGTGDGTWSSSNTSVAAVTASGSLTGVATGVATISYILTSTGCGTATAISVNAQPGAISGTTTVCQGATSALSNTVSGGAWSSDNTAIANINATTGVVTGITAGTANVSYTIGTCGVATVVAVNAAPATITGNAAVCIGTTSPLATTGTGGAWSSANTAIANVDASGVVSGVAPGTALVSYSLGTGCNAAKIVTINALPSSLVGATSICAGATTALSNAMGGGAWSSANTAVAVVSATGVVTGVAAGTAVISYSLGACSVPATINVAAAPSVITGAATICSGATTTLSADVAGGTWASANTAIANIDAASGLVASVATGTTSVSYTLSAGCSLSKTITVTTQPGGIDGNTTLCTGTTTTLSNVIAGGAWSSSNTAVAAVVSGTGVVSGVAAGAAIINYTIGTCSSSAIVTVTAIPSALTGTATVCTGASTTLSASVSGGTWSSSNTATATVASGVVYGVAAGTATIAYTTGAGCVVSKIVTINASPATVLGTAIVCAAATTTLTDATGSGTWSSGTTSVVTIGASTGVATGVSAGTATVYYTVANGCNFPKVITVLAVPSAFTGTATVCAGATTTLAETATGGVWSSSNTAKANVTNGTVTGVASGTATISYTVGSLCYATKVVTVNAVPAAITGTASACTGATTTLADGTASGTWSSGTTSIVTIVSGTGVATGVAAGTATVSYKLSTGCGATAVVTINAVPAAITGTATVCAGATTALADATAGGAWSSSATAKATIANGTVTGVAAGTSTISYTNGGCYATKVVTVTAVPAAITGTASVCAGSTTTLADGTASGTWASSSTAIAAVASATGVVTGASAGTVTISYSLSTGCRAFKTVTVNALPAAVGGTATVCAGSATTLTDATASGTWTSGTTAKATVVSSTGVVTGVASGSSTITYTLGTGCKITKVVTVYAVPASVSGSATICIGSTATLTDGTASGTWSSSNTALATVVSSTGVVKGVAAGTPVITYKLSTGCFAVKTVTIHSCARETAARVCVGSTVNMANGTEGGSWSCNDDKIAKVDAATGIVTGIAAGNAIITYSLTGAQDAFIPLSVFAAASPVTLTASPSASITEGESVTLAAVSADNILEPSYQWSVNGNEVTGANAASFTGSNFANNDQVICKVNGICGEVPVTNAITIKVNKATRQITTVGDNIRVSPNPNNGSFTIKGALGFTDDQEVSVTITDMVGRIIYTKNAIARNGNIDENIQLKNTVTNGMYVLTVHSANANTILHIVVEQ